MRDAKRKPTTRAISRQGGHPRVRILVESLQVIRALRDHDRHVEELAWSTGLGERKVYRIFNAIQEVGWMLAIREDAAVGRGRCRRRDWIASQPEVLR